MAIVDVAASTAVRETQLRQTLDGISLVHDAAAACLEPAAYLSQTFYDAEMRHVFPCSWIYVCDEREVEQPGDFLTVDVGGIPILVVHGEDGVIRALSNVCSHQACVLKDGRGNTGRAIICPYHAWAYSLDGSLNGVAMPDGFPTPVDRSARRLPELRLENWKGLLFVNVSGDAPPLIAYLDESPNILANHDFGEVRPQLVFDEVADVNWKILIENFGEDYHCPQVHGTTLCATIQPARMVETEWINTADIFVDERLDPEASAGPTFSYISPELTGETRHRLHVVRVFPDLLLIGNPNGEGWIQQYIPLGLASTRVRVWVYKRFPDATISEPAIGFIRAFMMEDFVVCGLIQRGIASPLYPGPGPRHRLQVPANLFRRRLLECMRDGLSRAATEA